jgi:O-succinylbenzoic acid--CoA ligase
MTDPLSVFAAAQEAGGAPALRQGARTYSYAELAAATRARLAALDGEAHPGVPYPLVGSNSLETIVTLYALLERRVPALLLHPRLTEPERAALVATAAGAGPVPHADAAAIMYTSGTTGVPRGAVLTRAALVASAAASAANLGWQPDDCWLLCMPLAHVGGLSILTRCLVARRCVALAPRFDAAAFPDAVEEARVTLVSLVPTMLDRVLDARPDWTAPARLRAILLGGAVATPRLLRRAVGRGLPVLVSYGLTETCAQVTATPYATRYAPLGQGAGLPLPGTRVRVVDGRIEVGGATLMAGYLGLPPLVPGAWFDTGDLGEIDARGCLHVHARRTDLIVTGGENVYPAEVEHALEACPGIAGAGVFGVADETWGQTVAAVLVAEAAPPPDAALQAYFAAHLAPHKRPRRICYAPRLPQTAAGKLDRGALAAHEPALRPLAASASDDPRDPG